MHPIVDLIDQQDIQQIIRIDGVVEVVDEQVEVEEELGLVLDAERLELVAVHRTAAANEAGRPLIASVFRHPHLAQQSRPTITPAAEIEEVRWTVVAWRCGSGADCSAGASAAAPVPGTFRTMPG